MEDPFDPTDPDYVHHDDPRYDGFRIQELWVVLAVDEHDQEGLVQAPTDQGLAPLFAADRRRLEQIKALVPNLKVMAPDMTFKLVHFKLDSEEVI